MNKVKSHKIKLLALMLVAILTLSGCVQEPEIIATPSGGILTYTDIASLEDGYYIQKKNGNIHPLLPRGGDFIAWNNDLEKLIPSYEDGDEIVFISSSGSVPNSYTFTHMEDVGWTLPIGFSINYTPTNDGDDNSTHIGNARLQEKGVPEAEGFIAHVGEDALVEYINKQTLTPNMLSDEGFLRGLTKDARYEISYYNGTKHNEVSMLANVRVVEKGDEYVSNSVIPHQAYHFTLKPAEDMVNGFYVLNGRGLFRYAAGEFVP